jgi:hypothetical protein
MGPSAAAKKRATIEADKTAAKKRKLASMSAGSGLDKKGNNIKPVRTDSNSAPPAAKPSGDLKGPKPAACSAVPQNTSGKVPADSKARGPPKPQTKKGRKHVMWTHKFSDKLCECWGSWSRRVGWRTLMMV